MGGEELKWCLLAQAKHFSKKYGNKGASITLYLQSVINFCSVRMPVNA